MTQTCKRISVNLPWTEFVIVDELSDGKVVVLSDTGILFIQFLTPGHGIVLETDPNRLREIAEKFQAMLGPALSNEDGPGQLADPNMFDGPRKEQQLEDRHLQHVSVFLYLLMVARKGTRHEEKYFGSFCCVATAST
jgi:hypothetical protein